jgi:hypothetical protein
LIADIAANSAAFRTKGGRIYSRFEIRAASIDDLFERIDLLGK